MIIEREILDHLFTIYRESLGGEIVDQSSFENACQFIENNLTNHFDWENDSVNPELEALLKRCLLSNAENTNLVFNEQAALTALSEVKQQFSDANRLYLAHDVESTGIQEKYLRSVLSAEESLTDLDIKRFILETKMVDKIHVTNLKEQDLGLILHSIREKQVDATAPYSISMMVNEGGENEPRWLSVIIHVNPLQPGAISYRVNAGHKLDDTAKEQLELKLIRAINYKIPGTAISAFPLATVSGEIKSEDLGKLGAYKSLHALYKAQPPRGQGYEESTAFSQLEDNLDSIKQFVYQTELRAITLLPEESTILSPQMQLNFENGHIKPELLERQSRFMEKPTPIAAGVQHPMVVERFSELQLYHNSIRFPGDKPDVPLTNVDYLQFLMLVQRKFSSSGTPKVLDGITINCHDNAALQGLAAYNGTRLPLPFKTLTLDLAQLDLAEPLARESFLFNLKLLLITMSDANLPELKIIDDGNQLSIDNVKELANFIKHRPVAIDITLPERFLSSNEQQQIDEQVSDNIRKKVIDALSKVPSKSQQSSDVAMEVRTRPQLASKQNLAIDIELQQEQQVEVAVEAGTESGPTPGQPEPAEGILYDLNTFAKALAEGGFASKAKDYLVSSNRDDTHALWCNWVGALTTAEARASGLKMSKTACEELLAHKDQFQYGIDLKNLPAGFSLTIEGQGRVLHFDEAQRLLAPYDALKVQARDSSVDKPLTNLQFQQWLKSTDESNLVKSAWDRMSQASYDKTAHRLFKQFLPSLLLLRPEDLTTLFQISQNEDGSLNNEKFRFLMENRHQIQNLLNVNPQNQSTQRALEALFDMPADASAAHTYCLNFKENIPSFDNHLLSQLVGENNGLKGKLTSLLESGAGINQLLQLYVEFGETGVDRLTSLVNSDKPLFQQLNTQVFAKTNSYAPLLREEYQEAIEAIKGLGKAERVWWDTLLQQHSSAQAEVNLVDLVNAFKQFKEELKKFPTVDGKPLDFPSHCELEGVKSLPVALSRILTLLKQSHEKHCLAQWQNVSKLDLSSTGMIKPISSAKYKQWAFITPEMNINAAHELSTGINSQNTEYECPSRWKQISSDDEAKIVQNFFRFAAYQEKNGQLDLEFYQYVHKQLSDSGLSLNVRKQLYPLIAGGTTKKHNLATIKSLAEAKADVDQLIKLVVDTPLKQVAFGLMATDALKEEARLGVLSTLSKLDEAPSLPVLNRLISLISGSLNSVTKIATNRPRLLTASNDLKRQVDTYGSAIYEGMKEYNDRDFDSGELFFEHMALANKIASFFPEEDIFNPASLLQIASTFHLKEGDVDAIIDKHFQEQNQKYIAARIETLSLLRKLTINDLGQRPLTPADLDIIFEAIKNTEKPVVDLFKELKLTDNLSLSNCFPKDVLENYGNTEIPSKVTTKINEQFPQELHQNQIIKILGKFSAAGDAEKYSELVDKIITICAPLPAIEKNIFLAKLSSSHSLYSNPKSLSEENNPFVDLLDTIIAGDCKDDFINLIAVERSLLRNSSTEQKEVIFIPSSPVDPQDYIIENLSDKALLYLKVLLPAIREIKDLNISQVDLIPRVLETLLKTPPTELSEKSSVVNEKKEFFDQQDESLTTILDDLKNEKRIHFKDAVKSTDLLIEKGGLKDNSSLENFKETLVNKEIKINLKQQAALISNPAFAALTIYMVDKELMGDTALAIFEEKYKAKLDQMFKDRPSLIVNKDLMNSLLKNPEFMDEFSKENVQAAASSHDLLDDDQMLTTVFNAVEKDLNNIAEFKKQVEELKTEVLREATGLNDYSNVFTELFTRINAVTKANPGSKKQFLDLYDRYLGNYRPDSQGEQLKYLTDFVATLENAFAKTVDKNIVLSLCLQFNSDDNEELQPEGLLALLKEVDAVPEDNQLIVLKIAIALINNEKDYNLDGFKELCAVVKDSPEFGLALQKIYNTSPFPTIDQVLEWHKGASATGITYDEAIEASYQAFDQAPCHREVFVNGKPVNGFHADKARVQLEKFKGFDSSLIDLAAFQNTTREMQNKTSTELLGLLEKFNPRNLNYDPAYKDDNDTLVAVAAELFHRSKGKDELDAEGNNKLGSSMEINTTQYLAILSMLKTPGHVTNEIGTGEGKSRIMMISNACQFALGKTVDFVTSDAQLATRDYVEYQAYFDMIGAKTSMIFAGSDHASYQKGGINFSDPSNLSLFRNKARSMGNDNLVLDESPENRALLLDEADKTYFDVADTRFNFSKEGDDNIRGMEWVYPLLMAYFAQDEVKLSPPFNGQDNISPQQLYYENVDLSREKFIQFASASCPPSQLMRLKALSNSQLEQWQVSAVTASQLKFKDDFVIEADVLISTPTGPKISSEAQLLFANRVSKSSKFSFGVHQCLHARLNLARENPAAEKDEKLNAALKLCEQAFYVPDEKQIVYSSTSKNLLDDYSAGTLKAVTGTSGSIIERQEARELYGLEGTKMQFIDVPRDRGLNRRDKSIRLTANANQQIRTLIEQIKKARVKNQPILIIAENDEESERLYKIMAKAFPKDEAIQHIHSQLSLKDEKDRIDIAGRPGQITISTDMVGRGTDISLQGASRVNGLNVMLTYLPRQRDLEQIIGRAGRFGAQGETSMVLDKARLKKALGKTTLSDGFYTRTEAYIEREQALMDRNKQCERLIKNTVGDFRKALTDNFFNDMLKNTKAEDTKKLLPIWTAFFDKSDKAWNEQWPHIQKELSADPVDIAKIKNLLDDYQANAQKMWASLRRSVQDIDVTCIGGQKPTALLADKLQPLALSQSTKALLTQFDISDYSLNKVKVWDHYDKGHDGRAVTYSNWTIPVIASLKGWANLIPGVNFENARQPFANTRAWLEDRGQLFADFRGSPNKGKIIGAAILGVVGAAVGAALIATGVLAPLGVTVLGLSSVATTAIITAAAGLAIGAVTGLAGGAIVDAVANRSSTERSQVVASLEEQREPESLAEIEPEIEPVFQSSYGLLNNKGLVAAHQSHSSLDDDDELVQPVIKEQVKDAIANDTHPEIPDHKSEEKPDNSVSFHI